MAAKTKRRSGAPRKLGAPAGDLRTLIARSSVPLVELVQGVRGRIAMGDEQSDLLHDVLVILAEVEDALVSGTNGNLGKMIAQLEPNHDPLNSKEWDDPQPPSRRSVVRDELAQKRALIASMIRGRRFPAAGAGRNGRRIDPVLQHAYLFSHELHHGPLAHWYPLGRRTPNDETAQKIATAWRAAHSVKLESFDGETADEERAAVRSMIEIALSSLGFPAKGARSIESVIGWWLKRGQPSRRRRRADNT